MERWRSRRRTGAAIAERDTAAAAAEELLRSAFDHAPIGMSVVAADGTWLRVNDEYCRMFGYERAELLALSWRDLVHPDEHAARDAYWAAVVAGERDSLAEDRRHIRKDGTVPWFNVRSEVVRDRQGVPLYSVSHLIDVTERRAAQARLRDSERTLRSVIDNTPAVVSVKDRDLRYRMVNRGFEELFAVTADWVVGRAVEDFLSPDAAAQLRRRDSAVLRGDMPLPEEEVLEHDDQQRIFLTLRFPLLDESDEIVGVCCMSTDVTERRAEETLRRERLQCSELVHSALAQDRFVLYAQPIVNLATMAVDQSELLIRLRPEATGSGLVGPPAFLPAAEQFGFIRAIDVWVVARAVALAKAGHVVEVNVSATTISDPALVDRIEQMIVTSGAPPKHLIFEITETAVADNLEAARDFALRLRDLGCAFALDDFGVGHGTFTYLRHLPVDYLKIDMQFVRDLLTDTASRHVVQAIIGVAAQFAIKTIAEGVEDDETLAELRRLGVDYAQGYLLGRPAPLDRLTLSPSTRGETHAPSPG